MRQLIHWSKLEERGSSLGLQLLLFIYRFGGRFLVKAALYPVVGYFFLTGRQARNASFEYLTTLYQASYLTQKPSLKMSYLHFLSMAHAALDKVDVWLGNITMESIILENQDVIEALNANHRGGVIIGSHLGNLEICRALSFEHAPGIFNILVFTEHAKKFNDFLEKVNPRVGINLIEVKEFGPQLAILLQEKIDMGEYVVVAGDRTSASVSGRITSAKFLGKAAPFSQGPFILAGLLKCPVLTMFCLRDGNKFRLIFEMLTEKVNWNRANRAAELTRLTQAFANSLEKHCAMFPLQWFNFFDFWQSDNAER